MVSVWGEVKSTLWCLNYVDCIPIDIIVIITITIITGENATELSQEGRVKKAMVMLETM